MSALTPSLLKVFESLPDLYLILTPDLVILTASNAYLEATFTQRQAITGKYVFDVFPDNPAAPHASAVQNLHASLREVIATRMPHQMDLQRYDVPRLVPEGGFQEQYFEEKYWLPLNTPVVDDEGDLLYLIHKVEDVTSRQRAERALQTQQELLQTVFEATPLSLTLYKILYDSAGRVEDFEIRLFNAFTERITGLTTQQVVGKRYGEVFPTTLETGVLEVFKQVARSGEAAEFERWYEGEGMRHWFRFIINKVDTWLVVATEDITPRKRTEEAIALQNAQLTRTNADLDNFIYTASHDLKSPILNIEGLLKVLSRKVDPLRQQDETLKQLLAMMEASVMRFKATIMDLTDITRIGKQMELEGEPVNLQQIVSDILLDLHEQVMEAGAVIEPDLKACPMILFPRKNLKSVVYNLLSNAIKYRSPERTPHVTLTCYEQADFQVLSVQDNGLGMDTRNPEKIFGMFKRQHAHVEGTGVGLYIVKKMIENAGGKIEVESKVGQGSTFRVYFKQ